MSEEAWAGQQLNTSVSDILMSVGWAALKEFVGWDGVDSCFTGVTCGPGSLILDAKPILELHGVPDVIRAANQMTNAISA
ncbi:MULTISPECIES: hypothetical protein [unclassified Streptomyces]|uniref:hypothetical protein n=1 Tax=unclassified Streptomyces TaxID=2593676 RepID=UPI0033A0602F